MILVKKELLVAASITCFVYLVDAAEDHWPAGELNCVQGLRDFNPLTQKKKYIVGVHAPGGEDNARADFNLTFVEYLNEAVGKKWQPPIEFEMTTSEDPLTDWIDNEAEVDFMYSDTGLFSCFGVEVGGQPLGTTIARLPARGREHELDVFAGTMLTRADNEDIQTVDDIKGKVIGALAISDFAGAQVQFYVMKKNGLDYIMDPEQVIFTGNELEIAKGVLDGRWDVGYVRTGIVERTKDENGKLVDPDLFRVLEPKIYIMDSMELFPFLHSTPVFPEWPFYARNGVDRVVSEEVQLALISFEYHHLVGERIHDCRKEICEAAGNPNCTVEVCNTAPPVFFDPKARCDTTRELAELAYQAGTAGRHAGFRPARSHFDLRSMQQEAGFLSQKENGDWYCPRAPTLYDALQCPEGHYKITREQFKTQCSDFGLPCPDGMSCYCQPCIKAFEVDVFEWNHDDVNSNETSFTSGCDKMSLCGTLQQTKEVTFLVRDNVQRDDAEVSAKMHMGQDSFALPVVRGEGAYTYAFSFSDDHLGVGILEVYINGEQIPESPFRVQVIERDCQSEFPGNGKTATESGTCECGSDTIKMGSECVPVAIIASVVAVFAALVLLAVVWFYLGYKRAKSDEVWQVGVEELHFSQPVEVIGEGSFGVVLMAEYRGTKVAIKRIVRTNDRRRKSGTRTGSKIGSASGSVGSAGGKSSASSPSADDLEAGVSPVKVSAETLAKGTASMESGMSMSGSIDSELDFLGGLSFGGHRKGLAKWLPWIKADNDFNNANILGTASGNKSSTAAIVRCCPWLDENRRRQQEFLVEMRLLSRLRHPCITTVMGAVITRGQEPMMVMEYMENGSLHDLLCNETLYTGGEIIVQIVRDVAQGLRFLHSSKPAIMHGDLKAKNILIDARFRAKVADFGLATRTRKNGISGTPFWMAPEYLRGKTEYTTSCDIYSFGIILYEIYGRKSPYDGEHPRKVLRKVCDPRVNKRPPVPSTCPPKMVEIMKKCWSSDAFFRPQAKELDMLFMDMSTQDAEPVVDNGKMNNVVTEDMLYRVFPRKVADLLKAGKKVEQETHDNVTILFSDIVHFTNISQTLSPSKVCDMLDRLYVAFDELSSKHGVFKVETIGDAYMGVTNLDNDMDGDHAKRIALFAIDAVEAAGKILIDEENPNKGCVKIRVGFHSGAVVSNVIGSLNPRYGLFGDAVNTASRMESNSLSGKIHCSQDAAKILAEQAPDIPMWKRGKIGIKGKGEMVTYFVGLDPSNAAEEKTTVNFAVDPVSPAVQECAPQSKK